jgi:hypothetical protein
MTLSSYSDADVRGRLRQWKMELHERYEVINRALNERALVTDVEGFCQSRSPTIKRQRAFDGISRLLAPAGVTLEGVRLDGKAPIAVWSLLKPRSSVALDPDDPANAQNCISVNYFIIGSFERGIAHCGDGLWTLAIPDHAMERLMHRTEADPAACLSAAHHAALRLRDKDAVHMHDGKLDPSYQFLIPAGPGAFVCSLRSGRDISRAHTPMLHVGAHTWLSDDMLRDDQTPLIDDGSPGDRLGDSWLLPAPMRRTTMDDAGMARVTSLWAPGMPKTLAAPKGRA